MKDKDFKLEAYRRSDPFAIYKPSTARGLMFLLLAFFSLWLILVVIKWRVFNDLSTLESFAKATWFLLGGFFLAFTGFAPLLSTHVRDRCCRPEPYFASARGGLLRLGLFGALFFILGCIICFDYW